MDFSETAAQEHLVDLVRELDDLSIQSGDMDNPRIRNEAHRILLALNDALPQAPIPIQQEVGRSVSLLVREAGLGAIYWDYPALFLFLADSSDPLRLSREAVSRDRNDAIYLYSMFFLGASIAALRVWDIFPLERSTIAALSLSIAAGFLLVRRMLIGTNAEEEVL